MKIRNKVSKTVDGTVSDFKKFINRGNIFDLAIGVIIGGAFTTIVNSLVNDILMPIISRLINFDITKAKWIIREEVLDAEENAIVSQISINYGQFIQNVILFLVIAFSIFTAVKIVKWIKNGYIRSQIKYVKRLKKKHPEWFDEEDELGTILYEKLKTKYPDEFKNEVAEQIEQEKEVVEQKTPVEINNIELARLNTNLEKIYGLNNSEESNEKEEK